MNRIERQPLRKVEGVRFVQSNNAPIGNGSNCFTLECGHQVYAKASAGEPKRKRCYWCDTDANVGSVLDEG